MKKPILLIVSLLLFSCSGHIYRSVYPLLNDGKYDSEFPYKNCSQEIKNITESIAKIYSMTRYKVYYFDRDDKLLRGDLKESLLSNSRSISYSDNPVSGSSLVISSTDRAALLLTCRHVVDHSDTIFTYYKREEASGSRYIRTVAIKIQEKLLAASFPEDGVLELLASDPDYDIALIGKIWGRPLPRWPIEFSYPLGKGGELEWGSFVYLLGFPQGQEMVTKAIVSQPNRDGRGSFLLDANFNRGFSGGIVLAVRDGVPNFEMVGMAYSSSGTTEAILIPSPDAEYDMLAPYDGSAYATSINRINYGITFVVPTEAIIDFISRQKNRLQATAYEYGLSSFLQKAR